MNRLTPITGRNWNGLKEGKDSHATSIIKNKDERNSITACPVDMKGMVDPIIFKLK